ncbi:MAG: hypothetical protein KYX69_19845 [Sphingomonas sp.]|uniref:hypothetical protein n=1 Tax=Sphingomonas sp. TaxID=28214 RepID=UPI002620E45D|nr:hypothetical protein [Sphingomonas sp.]MDK2769958.1 hypothetical protein [Sphingomonas sp.]
MSTAATTARAVMIGDRFFCGFNRSGAVRTAWCIAGARLFQARGTDHEIDPVLSRLEKARKRPAIVTVTVEGAR